MTIALMENFLCWSLLINMGFLMLWTLAFLGCPNTVFKMHKKFFDLDKNQWVKANYMLLGFYKLMVILFNLVPYLALKMI